VIELTWRRKIDLPGNVEEGYRMKKKRQKNGAEDEIRTRDLLLGKEMLYQLSHFRSLYKLLSF
jgi:hypothetical protein